MDTPMSSGSGSKIEIITGVQRRRRWTPEQKLAWVKRTTEPGMSVSLRRLPRQVDKLEVEISALPNLGRYTSGGRLPRDS